ncbi:hypothetical protein HYPSUDRAFT_61806 [Hypholoma sublateritium FD-334 SS-4]|uniref:DUF6533 domain-containing protein n=1 Tax=Hypholoma sublateritium (strain FD-334 SS-4) TaxID=945553 RepID=A0A0D2MXY9_HYPSF|nr:hypothetical protein HYPSUDRAFT_61806 [Hypholoma sublateritium FD-334 SS-4]
MDIARGGVLAAAVVNIAELATQIDEEVEYIWTRLRDIRALKVMYIFARYYPFLLYYQSFVFGDLLEHLEPARRSKEDVALWLLYKTCALQALLWSIDFALLKRVHLLFGSTRKMLLIVSALGLAKLCLDVVIAVDIYGIMQANGTGVYTSPTKPLVIFAAGEAMLQFCLFFLARKSEQWAKHARTPVTSRLNKHRVEPWVVVLATGACPTVYVYSLDLSPCVYPAIALALSISGCRLILSLHHAFYIKKRTTFDYMSSDSDSAGEDYLEE